MADSIKVAWQAAVSMSPFNDNIAREFSTAPAARGTFSSEYTLAANHAESAMTISGVAANGLAYLDNVGTSAQANEILVGPESAGAQVDCLRILRGESLLIRLPTSGVTLRAKTGASETAVGKLRLTVRDN